MAALRDFVDNQLDASKDLESQLSETLSILNLLAERKAKDMVADMNKQWNEVGESKLPPGTFKDYDKAHIHVVTSSSSDDMTKGITGLIDKVFAIGTSDSTSNAVRQFLTETARTAIDSVMGSGVAENQTDITSVVYPDHSFLCRCDVGLWRYKIRSASFRTRVQSVVVARIQYGAIDLATPNILLALAHWLDRHNIDTKAAEQAISRARELVAAAQEKRVTPGAGTGRIHRLPTLEDRRELMRSRGIEPLMTPEGV
ncbi:MAG TPA: hypothetical protein VN201_11870 [Roseateles sp.]|nr:hypothetical protein [Roseateles sp.]